MVRPCTLSLALVLATGLAAQRSESLVLHFPLASAAIDKADEAALRALCDREDVSDVSAITLIGHTDVQGPLAYNEALSERRAEAVRSALRSTCLEGKAVHVRWSGETEPVALGAGENDHALNRCVDVLLEYATTADLQARPDAHPRVVPLLPAIDKPKERYRVNAAEAIDMTMSDGVRVRIPAGAIVNADGTPVNEPVDLSYRSFLDPYEIIASGIPMHVNGDAGTQHMETAGMYELYASLNGAPLGLAPGTNITLQQPQAPALDPDFIGWELDPGTGAWVPRGTVSSTTLPAPSPVTTSTATAATSSYWNELWQLEKEKRLDSTLFTDRRNSRSYARLKAMDTTNVRGGWFRPRYRTRRVDGVASIKVKAYRGVYDPEHVAFVLDLDGEDMRLLPEWRRIPPQAVWECMATDSRALFKMLYARQHSYQDIALEMNVGAEEGVLRLKENGDWYEIPVRVGVDRNGRLNTAQWERSLIKYTASIGRQQRNFDREVTRQWNRYKRLHGNMPLSAWKHARTAMDSSEASMDLQAWRDYASTRQPVLVNWGEQYANQQRDLEAVQTTFGLEGFGVYNIDRIMKMREQLNVLAAAVDADGKPWPWVNGFAVLKRENSVITYWGQGKGTGDFFYVSPGQMEALFLVDAEGRIARADVAPLNSRDPRVVLKVTPLDDPKSIDELKATAMK